MTETTNQNPKDAKDLKDLIAQAVKDATAQVLANSRHWAGVFPDDATVNNFWTPRGARDGFAIEGANHGWTTSFWTGMQWLAYELTGNDELKVAAQAGSLDHVRRAIARQDTDTHDLGFLYSLSAVADWMLTGNETAREGALLAAELLLARFLEPAGIIQAWGDLSDPEQQGRGILDSMLNLPLLVWAYHQTGDERFMTAVRRHAKAITEQIIRADNSTYHTFFWDPVTGEPLRGTTHQGATDNSCWSRGQAWGIYGFTMAYQATGDPELLDAAIRVTDYYLDHLPADAVPYWDFIFTEDDRGAGERAAYFKAQGIDPASREGLPGFGEQRDASAAAITICGLRELVNILRNPADDHPRARQAELDRAARYEKAADQMLYSLITGYTPAALNEPSDALLLHTVYNKPNGHGIDEATQWGDYFYLEALMRSINPNWHRYW